MRAIPTSARKTAPGLATETGMASAAPTAAVSITRATTRGLPSDQKSRTRGNSAAARAGVFTDSGAGEWGAGWERGWEQGWERGESGGRLRVGRQATPPPHYAPKPPKKAN